MSVFGLVFDRPDKRAPFISWFTTSTHADRTAQSIMHLTAKDYGVRMEFYDPAVGWKENLKLLIRKSGETRLRVTIACFEAAPEGVIVHDRPRRIICWERAKADEIAYFQTAPRSPIQPVERLPPRRIGRRRRGAEIFMSRRTVTE